MRTVVGGGRRDDPMSPPNKCWSDLALEIGDGGRHHGARNEIVGIDVEDDWDGSSSS